MNKRDIMYQLVLLSPVLSKLVHPLDKDGHDSCHTDIDEVLKVLDSFLLIVVQTKLVVYLTLWSIFTKSIIAFRVNLIDGPILQSQGTRLLIIKFYYGPVLWARAAEAFFGWSGKE